MLLNCLPVLLHPGNEPECGHGDVVRLLAELEAVGEAHDVQARVHRRDVDAQLLRQPEVSPAQLVDVDLEARFAISST